MSGPCKMILRMQCNGSACWLSLGLYYYLYGHLQGPVYKTLQTRNLQKMAGFRSKLKAFASYKHKHAWLDKHTSLLQNL